MKYDNNIMGRHAGLPPPVPQRLRRRKSIRLKGYDYSQSGLYFITICCQNRAHLFGEIIDGEMIMNEAGIMVEKWYYELENKFPDIRCHEMVVMPNHFHCIIEIVWADPCVCPNNDKSNLLDLSGEHVTGEHVTGEHVTGEHVTGEHVTGEHVTGEHVGSPLRCVVQWFKTMTTNHYIRGVKQHDWQRFDGKLWQRNYWEHIIRNKNDYQRIAQYIINNPQNWNNDKLI